MWSWRKIADIYGASPTTGGGLCSTSIHVVILCDHVAKVHFQIQRIFTFFFDRPNNSFNSIISESWIFKIFLCSLVFIFIFPLIHFRYKIILSSKLIFQFSINNLLFSLWAFYAMYWIMLENCFISVFLVDPFGVRHFPQA